MIWLALWTPLTGLTQDAGEAALRFVEKARAGELNLDPGGDTALVPETTTEKRKEIERRLKRLVSDIGDNTLEIADTRVDGGFAAALVRATRGFDPTQIRVFAIALVERDGHWLAAPVPASFENTGYGYQPEKRRRVQALRDWMLREQALDIERIKDEMAERMRREIARSLPADELQAMDCREAAQRFLDACARHKLPEMLGLLGGLSPNRPDDWAMRLNAAQAAAAGEPVSRPWQLLVSDHVLRAVVRLEEQDGEATVTIGCLDPGIGSNGIPTPRIRLLELPFVKSPEGLWRCDPPWEFYQPLDDSNDDAAGDASQEMMDAFVEKIAESHPPQPQAEARAALDMLLDTLTTRNLPAVIRLLPPPGENPAPAHEALSRAVHVWWSLSNSIDSHHAMRPSLGVEGETAAAVCQFFSPRNPDRPELRVFYFRKSDAGWFWLPVPGEELETGMRQWVRDQSVERQTNWRERLLAECVRLDRLPESAVPDAAAAERVVQAWLDATRAGDVEAALRLTARLPGTDSSEAVLRNLGYEITGNRMSEPAPRIIHHQRTGIWTAVGVRTVAGNEKLFPLYPVIRTDNGPRILIEIDLFAAGKRSRDFLNRTALARLDEQSPEATRDLRELLRAHGKRVAEPAP